MSLATNESSGSSSIDRKWILCLLASISGCILLTTCVRYDDDLVAGLQFWTLRRTSPSDSTNIAFSDIILTNQGRRASNTSITAIAVEAKANNNQPAPNNKTITGENLNVKKKKQQLQRCNIYQGHWVPGVNPMYHSGQCPFLSDQVNCRRNGRADSDYERWSWEANACQIPKFNGTNMLERLRGKRVIIVGDSLNRNQWESLACLLYSSIKNASTTFVDVESEVYKVFRAKEYNCSVEFHWSPFLVQMDNATEDGKHVLRLDKIIETAPRWKGADVMLFNTGAWWAHRGKSKSWDLFEHNGKYETSMEVESALEVALKTWSEWIQQNVDTSKTRVLFRSVSPSHMKRKYRCENQSEPIVRDNDAAYVLDFPRKIVDVVEKRIRRMGSKQVTYLNVTKLSLYRRDAHPSIYALTEDQKMAMGLHFYSDCSHWCLPGVPDTWNRLLYASLFLD